jgi:hypothetical protein
LGTTTKEIYLKLLLFIILLFNYVYAGNDKITSCKPCVSKSDINSIYRNCDNVRSSLESKINCLQKTYPEKEIALKNLKETLLNNHKAYQDNYTILLYSFSIAMFLLTIIGGLFGFFQKREIISTRNQYENELKHVREMFNELSKSSNSSIFQSRTEFLQMRQDLINSKELFEKNKESQLKDIKKFYQDTIAKYQAEKQVLENTITELEKYSDDLEKLKKETIIQVDKYKEMDSEIAKIALDTILKEEKLKEIITKIINNNIDTIISDEFIRRIGKETK